MALIVYFSTKSRNTHRFVTKLGIQSIEIQHEPKNDLFVDEPFVLVTPTYGGGYAKGAVPPAVIRFLNEESNRNKLIGVVSTGNRNFGNAFCQAGSIISEKCNVPNIASIELFGNKEDVEFTRQAILSLFKEEDHD